MQTEFRKGDLVRIREWDDMVNSFGLNEDKGIPVNDFLYFVPEMKRFCGRICRIEHIFLGGCVKLNKNLDPKNNWLFSTNMLELIEETEQMEKPEKPINSLIDF